METSTIRCLILQNSTQKDQKYLSYSNMKVKKNSQSETPKTFFTVHMQKCVNRSKGELRTVNIQIHKTVSN
jgi:hypothetical protein